MRAKNYPAATRAFEQCLKISPNYFSCVEGAAGVYISAGAVRQGDRVPSAEVKKSPDRANSASPWRIRM